MADQDNRALARRWFEEVWNQNRAETIDELLAPDVQVHGLQADGQPAIGRESFRKFYALFRGGLSGIRLTVDDVIAEGDRTAARVTLRATHSGEGFGVPATGRTVATTGIVWCRWRDGQVIEGWNEFDAAGLLRQIAPPRPATVKA